jgi:hypothetical protein
MNTPDNLRYTRSHEWATEPADGVVTVGITDFAQEQLGDVVFVDLPEVGRKLAAGEAAAVVESVKTASDIYAPLAGEVVETNDGAAGRPRGDQHGRLRRRLAVPAAGRPMPPPGRRCSTPTATARWPRRTDLALRPAHPDDVRRALAAIGVDHVDDLFADVPAEILDPPLDLGAPMDEVTLLAHLDALAAKDQQGVPTFLGGGIRAHFIPAVTPRLAMQSEFVTAYTPYQPEVAQGVLQATFEFQTMMAELTGPADLERVDVRRRLAVAEAALLAVRQTRRETIVVSRGVHPETREVLQTYLWPLGIEIEVVDLGRASRRPCPPSAITSPRSSSRTRTTSATSRRCRRWPRPPTRPARC